MNSLPMSMPALVVMSAPMNVGDIELHGPREKAFASSMKVAWCGADAHAAVDRRAEAAEVTELRVDDGGRLEDRLPLAQERVLVARRQDDRRDERQAQPVAGRVHQPDLRVDLQVAESLRGEGPVLRPRRGLIARRALPRHDRHREDDPELEAEVRQVREADRRLQRRRDQVVHRELVLLRRRSTCRSAPAACARRPSRDRTRGPPARGRPRS